MDRFSDNINKYIKLTQEDLNKILNYSQHGLMSSLRHAPIGHVEAR